MKKSKEHKYKGMIIKNNPYNSEPRWFILNKDNKRVKFKNGLEISPVLTLKEAKKIIDETL